MISVKLMTNAPESAFTRYLHTVDMADGTAIPVALALSRSFVLKAQLIRDHRDELRIRGLRFCH